MPDMTYIDQYIADGKNDVLSLSNFYDTILMGKSVDSDHIIRIPIGDFFLKHFDDFSPAIELHILSENLFYKPKTLSLQMYGTTELWLPILRVNSMRNITEFHQPLIKLYNPDMLKELINIFFKREKKY